MKKLSIVVASLAILSSCSRPVYHNHKALLMVSVREGYEHPSYHVYWDSVTLVMTPDQEDSFKIGDTVWALPSESLEGIEKMQFHPDTSGYERVVRVN